MLSVAGLRRITPAHSCPGSFLTPTAPITPTTQTKQTTPRCFRPNKVPTPGPSISPIPSVRPSPVPTPSPSDACSSGSEYRYKMILTDSGGDGWGGATFQISTDSTVRFSGTLATGMKGDVLRSPPPPSRSPTLLRSPPTALPGSYAVEYFCLEDGEHEVVVSGGSSTIDEACFEFDDTAGDSFQGCGAVDGG